MPQPTSRFYPLSTILVLAAAFTLGACSKDNQAAADEAEQHGIERSVTDVRAAEAASRQPAAPVRRVTPVARKAHSDATPAEDSAVTTEAATETTATEAPPAADAEPATPAEDNNP